MSEDVPDDVAAEDAAPEVRGRMRDGFGRQGLMSPLGGRLAHVGPGVVRIGLLSRSEVSQQHGFVHAGATSAIADTAGGYAAMTLFPEGSEVLTVEDELTLVAPPTASSSRRWGWSGGRGAPPPAAGSTCSG